MWLELTQKHYPYYNHQIGAESAHCKINIRQSLARLLRHAGLAVLIRSQTNEYSVWFWCSCQIKNNKQEIMTVPMHHLPWPCGSGTIKQIKCCQWRSVTARWSQKTMLINCVELLPANQQKQKTSQSSKSANAHMALAVDVGQKQNYQLSQVLAPATTK